MMERIEEDSPYESPDYATRPSLSLQSDGEPFRGPVVGSSLPFGPRMYQTSEQVVRMKDVGVGRRIIVVGVIGSYTPDCWNRHLYLVLKYYDYLKERGVDHIVCISTSDPFVHTSWGEFLGCTGKVLMWSDPLALYTKALGVDFVVPWLDTTERSKRYIILAEDMVVTKMTRSLEDTPLMRWDCDHLVGEEDEESVDSQDD